MSELKPKQPKYKIGQKVWDYDDEENVIRLVTITKVIIKGIVEYHILEDEYPVFYNENCLFDSLVELAAGFDIK